MMRRALALAAALALFAGPAFANPDPVSPQYGPSGVPPVTGAFTATGCTKAFTVSLPGRDTNVSGWGTFVATWQLFRSFDGGVTLLPITASGTTLYQWTAPASESFSESEYGVQYYACVTAYTSGTVNIRISQ